MRNKISPAHNVENQAAENQAIVWLTILNSPQLLSTQEQEFLQWLESSSLHQAAYIKIEQLWARGSVLSQLPEPSKTDFWQFDYWGVSVKGLAVACSCFLIVAIGLFSFLTKTTRTTYQTAMGEIRDIQLEDGSRITLNTNSQLNVELSRKKRMAYLTQGEVFFDVKKEGRAFDIETGFGVVRVLGTRFSVYQSGADAIVTVAEGRVALNKWVSLEEGFIPSVVLQANQRLSLLAARAGQSPEVVSANAELAWRKRQLVFNAESLSKVIAELGRYFPEAIFLSEPELANRKITAVIQLSDLKTTLQALSQSLNLRAEFDASGHEIRLFSSTPSPP